MCWRRRASELAPALSYALLVGGAGYIGSHIVLAMGDASLATEVLGWRPPFVELEGITQTAWNRTLMGSGSDLDV